MSIPENYYVFLFVIVLFTIPVVDGDANAVTENTQLIHASNHDSPS